MRVRADPFFGPCCQAVSRTESPQASLTEAQDSFGIDLLEGMVGTARFELATPCTPSKCATRLRYVPIGTAAVAGSVGLT